LQRTLLSDKSDYHAWQDIEGKFLLEDVYMRKRKEEAQEVMDMRINKK
jgi:hypothetical protein